MTSIQDHYVIDDVIIYHYDVKVIVTHILSRSSVWIYNLIHHRLRNGLVMKASFKDQYVIDDVEILHYDALCITMNYQYESLTHHVMAE